MNIQEELAVKKQYIFLWKTDNLKTLNYMEVLLILLGWFSKIKIQLGVAFL